MRNYWWPEVTRDVGKYVDSCDMCYGTLWTLTFFFFFYLFIFLFF